MLNKVFLLLPALAAVSAQAEPLNYNVVSFSESAVATVEKDVMKVTFVIEEAGKDRQEVSNRVTRRFNALTARIKAEPSFKSGLAGRNVRPDYNDKGKITGWNDSVYVDVESKNFPALNKLVAASQGEAAVHSMGFSVSPEKRSEVTNRLSKQVLKNFRLRAQVLSEALGFKSYKIVNIQINSDFRTYAAPAAMKSRMAYAAAAEAAPAPGMDAGNPGTEEIVQTVNGSIQM